jgi:hypothetical protein
MNASGGGGGGGNKQSSAPSSLRFFLGDRLVFTAGHNAPLPPLPPSFATARRYHFAHYRVPPPPSPNDTEDDHFAEKGHHFPFFANRNGNENENETKRRRRRRRRPKKKLTEIGIEELARIALRLAARAYLIQ